MTAMRLVLVALLSLLLGCSPDSGLDPDVSDGPDAIGADDTTINIDIDNPPDGPACPVLEPLIWDSGAETLQIPPDTLSILITLRGEEGDWLTTDHLSGPEGDLVVAGWQEDATSPLCLVCKNRVRVDWSVHSLLAPLAPAAESLVVPGTWQFAASSTGGAPIASGMAKRGSSLPATGVVTLAIHVTGANGLAAEAPELMAAIEKARAIYSQVGVDIQVTWHSAPDVRLDARVESLRADVFAHSQGAARAVPVYLVESLMDDGGTSLAGLSPVVGPANPDVAWSGVVLKVGVDTLGANLAHELGHYLGLWHTYELQAPSIKDPLPDTSPLTTVGDNLMTPAMAGAVLTEGQGVVIRRHPIVAHPNCVP
ncbi:MAG: hypothetical protein ACI9WU_000672 [Myxococcota bacterium]|jgi:hypothetical protein